MYAFAASAFNSSRLRPPVIILHALRPAASATVVKLIEFLPVDPSPTVGSSKIGTTIKGKGTSWPASSRRGWYRLRRSRAVIDGFFVLPVSSLIYLRFSSVSAIPRLTPFHDRGLMPAISTVFCGLGGSLSASFLSRSVPVIGTSIDFPVAVSTARTIAMTSTSCISCASALSIWVSSMASLAKFSLIIAPERYVPSMTRLYAESYTP